VNRLDVVFVILNARLARSQANFEERGATAVEYGLMVGLISVSIIGSVTYFGNSLTRSFNKYGNAVNSAGATS
jgi:pilus assembly protein Flp/PilA